MFLTNLRWQIFGIFMHFSTLKQNVAISFEIQHGLYKFHLIFLSNWYPFPVFLYALVGLRIQFVLVVCILDLRALQKQEVHEDTIQRGPCKEK